ncbi:MAG: hypothetical protein LBG98_01065, partial [Puniceicoccales bacterium]|nr:hypothetical protein [Puniceicoccales bacterium]
MDLFHLRLLMLSLACVSIVISLRDCFWNPKSLWCGRMLLRASVVGIFSIFVHGWIEEGMTWKVSFGMVW